MRTRLFTLLAVCVFAAPAGAAPVIDGTADLDYGAAKSTQNTKTQFGDSPSGDLIDTTLGGSEIDQVFATVSGGRLYVTVAGNLENNFNKLEVYLDTVAGGVHTIEETELPDRVDGYCCGNNAPGDGALQRHDGLTFDVGFNADYYLTFTHGNENFGGNMFWAMSAHYADLTAGAAGRTVAAGIQLGPQGRPVVLRFPFDSDFDQDSDADGADFLTWQRFFGFGFGKAEGDANGDFIVDAADLEAWKNDFGDTRQFSDLPYAPGDAVRTTALIGPTLPNLAQGDLIDKSYLAANGLVTPEIDFVSEAARNMENEIDLRMALNNSNAAGVEGGQGAPWDATGNAAAVTTGIEFSIPLSEIGNPAPGTQIKITAFVSSSDHDYASNQFSGTGILQNNPGGNGTGGDTGDMQGVILDDTLAGGFPGLQYVTVQVPSVTAVPEPGAIVLAGLAVLVGAAAARRRS